MQHRLLCKLSERVWRGLTICATGGRFSDGFEFCCAAIRSCESLKHVWTHLRAAVPRHQFINDSQTVRIFFSKCYIQLQIMNSGGNLYSHTLLLFNQSFVQILLFLFRYTVSSPVTKARIIAKQAALDMFSLRHFPRD